MQMNQLIDHLRRSTSNEWSGRTDGKLLELFVRHREGVALAALVNRHAQMVWGECRRVLSDHHDAEDAFQATFLVLVRKAEVVPQSELVGNLLYKALDHFAQIETLKRLDLYGSGESGVAPGRVFSMGGLQQLKKLPRLDTFYLTNLDSIGGGYVSLKELKHLRELSFMMTDVTEWELKALWKAMPNTRISSATGLGGWIGPKQKR